MRAARTWRAHVPRFWEWDDKKLRLAGWEHDRGLRELISEEEPKQVSAIFISPLALVVTPKDSESLRHSLCY